jgi:tetratricopeptide (TPR) repeat protein
MAYFRMGIAQIGTGQAEGFASLDKAVELSDQVTRKERLFIHAFKAFARSDTEEGFRNIEKVVELYPDEKEGFFWLGSLRYHTREYESAIPMLERAIELDPMYAFPHNMLAYCYNAMGDYENSLWAINKYISMAPDDANPYDTRAEIYAQNGEIALAIESYEIALQKKPDFASSLQGLGLLWIQKRDYEKARSYFAALASSSDRANRATGRNYLTLIPIYKGQYAEALVDLDNALAAAEVDGGGMLPALATYAIRATVYKELGDLDLAFQDIEKAIGIIEGFWDTELPHFHDLLGLIMALKGDTEGAKEIAEGMRERIQAFDPTRMYDYWQLMGEIERSVGNMDSAVVYMEKSNEIARGRNFGTRFSLARAYLEAGRIGDAVPILEDAVNRYDEGRLGNPIQSVKLHYMLGQAYESSGWTDKAIAQYEEFVEILKDADAGNSDLEDARERLERLSSGT